jgi:hypothetical protein
MPKVRPTPPAAARAASGWLRLVNPSAALRRISGLAGVGPILGINQIEIVQNNSR